MTKYQVFKQVTQIDSTAHPETSMTSFVPVGEYDANDAKGAVKAAILAMPESAQTEASKQTFAACASSSWQILTPTVNVETTVSFA